MRLLSAAEQARILADRATRLAVPNEPEAQGTWLEVLSFERTARHYAIQSRFVIEVGRCGRLSRVPGADALLAGLLNWRGDLLPVFELGLFGDTATANPGPSSRLLVLGEDGPDFGILVDAVHDVSRLAEASLSAPDLVGPLSHAECVRGITKDGAMLLDGAALLRDRKIFVAKRSRAASPEKDLT